MNETVDLYRRTQVAAWIACHGAESATAHLLASSAYELYEQLHDAAIAIPHEPTCCAALNALEEIRSYTHDLAHQIIELEAAKLAPALVNTHLPEARSLAEQEHEAATVDLDRAVEILVQALTDGSKIVRR